MSRTVKAKQHIQHHPIHEEYKIARKAFMKEVKKTKLIHWNEYLEDADQHNIWSTHKYLIDKPSDHFLSHIPSLHHSSANQTFTLTDQPGEE